MINSLRCKVMNSDLKHYMLNLLSKKDYSVAELIDKAQGKGYSGVEIKEVITWLEEKNYVNDMRIAQNIVSMYSKTRGQIWVKQKLSQKKISLSIISRVIEETQFEPGDDLKAKIEKKYSIDNWDEIEPKLKQKIANYLNRQGFKNSWEIIDKFRHS